MPSIVVFADVKGEFAALERKLAKIVSKTPLDGALCVGDFWGEVRIAPPPFSIPLFVHGEPIDDTRSSGAEFLGLSGMRECLGMNVAFHHSSCEGVSEMLATPPRDSKIHVFLSDALVEGTPVEASGVVGVNIAVGNVQIPSLLSKLNPKYAFAAGGLKLALPPYRRTSGRFGFSTTRLISIAPLTNSIADKKLAKNVHAVKITDEDAGDVDAIAPFFVVPVVRKRGREESREIDSEKRLKKDQRTDCWFCVSTEASQKHLVVGLGSESYVAMPKGAILSQAHLMVIPLAHETSIAAIKSPKTRIEIAAQCFRVSEYLRKEHNMDVLFFERRVDIKNAAQAHTFVECLPIPMDAGEGDALELVIASTSEAERVVLKPLPTSKFPNDTYKQCLFFQQALVSKTKGSADAEYLFLHAPCLNKAFLYVAPRNSRKKPKKMPLQLGRLLCCNVNNLPDRRYWQDCVLGDEEEATLGEQVRNKFAKVPVAPGSTR